MFYFSAAAGMVLAAKGKHNRLLYIAYYFLFMNMNVFKGIAYLAKKQGGTWEKSKRA